MTSTEVHLRTAGEEIVLFWAKDFILFNQTGPIWEHKSLTALNRTY